MPDALTLAQLLLSAFLLVVIVERGLYLLARAPVSPEALAFILRALEQEGAAALAEIWAKDAPHTHVGQLLGVWLTSREPDAVSELLFDLSARAGARLRVLRVGATIASTTGLLIGIIRIRGGLGKPAGLLALEAGLAEKVALGQALSSMAVGVATSAVCFYALSKFRDAAGELITQAGRVARALERAAHP